MFVVLAAMTPLLGKAPPTPPAAKKQLLIGSTIIGFFGESTLINILYASHTIWSVIVDAVKGEGNAREYWPARLGGAALLLGAIILAVLK